MHVVESTHQRSNTEGWVGAYFLYKLQVTPKTCSISSTAFCPHGTQMFKYFIRCFHPPALTCSHMCRKIYDDQNKRVTHYSHTLRVFIPVKLKVAGFQASLTNFTSTSDKKWDFWSFFSHRIAHVDGLQRNRGSPHLSLEAVMTHGVKSGAMLLVCLFFCGRIMQFNNTWWEDRECAN